MLNGWKTIITSAVSLIGAVSLGSTVEMTPMQHALVNAFFAGSYVLIIIFRLAANTTFGKNTETKVEGDLGITHEQMVNLLAPLVARMPQGDTIAALVDSVAQVHTAVQDIKTLASAPAGSTTTTVVDRVGDVSRSQAVTVVPPAAPTEPPPVASAVSLTPLNAGLVDGGSIIFRKP